MQSLLQPLPVAFEGVSQGPYKCFINKTGRGNIWVWFCSIRGNKLTLGFPLRLAVLFNGSVSLSDIDRFRKFNRGLDLYRILSAIVDLFFSLRVKTLDLISIFITRYISIRTTRYLTGLRLNVLLSGFINNKINQYNYNLPISGSLGEIGTLAAY